MLMAKYKRRKKETRARGTKPKTNPWTYSLYIGLFAGLIWGAVKMLEFALRFTQVVPGFLLEPFFRHAFLVTWQGILLGYASFILFSIAAAFLYGAFLRKLKGPWPGLAYGVVWWGLIFLLIGPFTEMVPAITQLDINSFATDLSLFLLWGMFIGYSISMEFTDEWSRDTFLANVH
jgi:hypothetical protein